MNLLPASVVSVLLAAQPAAHGAVGNSADDSGQRTLMGVAIVLVIFAVVIGIGKMMTGAKS